MLIKEFCVHSSALAGRLIGWLAGWLADRSRHSILCFTRVINHQLHLSAFRNKATFLRVPRVRHLLCLAMALLVSAIHSTRRRSSQPRTSAVKFSLPVRPLSSLPTTSRSERSSIARQRSFCLLFPFSSPQTDAIQFTIYISACQSRGRIETGALDRCP